MPNEGIAFHQFQTKGPQLGILGDGLEGELMQFVGAQRLKDQQLTARKEGWIQPKRGVLGGRANQGELPAFDGAQETVLLGFVKPMDFIQKQKWFEQTVAFFDDGPDIFDPGIHRA
jgi:hypothetical protein